MRSSRKAASALRYLTGAVQLASIVPRFGTLLANSPSAPTWNKDAEFRSPRVAMQS
jgi:hypothetical protein